MDTEGLRKCTSKVLWQVVLEHCKIPVAKQRPSGDLYILCPFHNERTPSCRISQKYQTFKCFGCGVAGDQLDFLFLLCYRCDTRDPVGFPHDKAFEIKNLITSLQARTLSNKGQLKLAL